MGARYITTTLPYVNDVPHLGHALELVQADALARSARLQGDKVFFSTGTDEHGQKVAQKAGEKGEDVQVFVDRHAEEFKKLGVALNLSNDAFIRTTDPKHIEAAQELWRRCEASGDIYKKKYSGLYCVGDEAFIKESDLVAGRCPTHPNQEPVKVEEENYFFKLSKYQDRLVEYLAKEESVVPEWRRQEALNFVNQGLEDFSISREKSRLSWGIPVPGDDTQVMYVWFDALANYISTLGWPNEDGDFKKFWVEGDTLQLAGKDQIRFQSIMWQAMLFSADIKNTDTLFYHGFINSGGQKMSKSIGNVISPYELVEKYGTDATRYLLLRHVHPFEDSDITWERLDEWYTANLVNGLGNFVARVMKLAEANLTSPVAPISSVDLFHSFDGFEFNTVMNVIWKRIQELDERITNEEPFKVIKVDAEKGREMISKLAIDLYFVGYFLQACMPKTSVAIMNAVKENKKPENIFPRLV